MGQRRRVTQGFNRARESQNLLKINRDYKVQYSNHINANADGETKKGNGIGTNFNAKLPSAKIIGLGNYEGDTLQVNFNIIPAKLADGNSNAAKGVTLNCSSQIVVNQTKDVNPFASVKLGKNLTKDKDFTLSLTPMSGAKDAEGKDLPKKEIEGAQACCGTSCGGRRQLCFTGSNGDTAPNLPDKTDKKQPVCRG